MAPGESRAKKGNQTTQSRITWFREEHNLCGDCCNFGEMPSLYSPVFSARSCKKRQGVCNLIEIQRLPDFNEPLNIIVKQRGETGNEQLVLIAAIVRAGFTAA